MRTCAVEHSSANYPCSGRVHPYELTVDSQPPGKGSFNLHALVHVCDAHAEFFKKNFSNVTLERA